MEWKNLKKSKDRRTVTTKEGANIFRKQKTFFDIEYAYAMAMIIGNEKKLS